MKDFPIPPDDPRLTAYALGELEGDERAVVEAALRRDPALRAAVDEIRATTAQIESALAAEAAVPEPANAAPATRPIVLVTGEERRPHGATGRNNGAHRPAKVRAKLLAFPQFYYVVGGLAAACFAVLVALHEPPPAAPAAAARTVTYREIALQPASSEQMAVTVPIPAV